MKTMSATLVSVLLAACPALAEDTYRSTMNGTVTIQVVPQEPTEPKAAPRSLDSLTIRFAPPSEAADEDDVEKRLSECGARWNRTLHASKLPLPKNVERYIAYYEKWKNYPAQRPPKPPESASVPTRASYRAYMAACLGEVTEQCSE